MIMIFKPKISALAIILLLSSQAYSQYISNPSFEGTPGVATPPSNWVPFDSNSTPDTEDLLYPLEPSDGSSFITLVSRGPESSTPNTFENCQTQLLQPLEKGECYEISLDLASSDILAYCTADGIIHYDSPSYLNIYGSNSSLNKGDLLASSPEINETEWNTFTFEFKIVSEIKFLTLEIGLKLESSGFGNIQIDNLSIIPYSQINKIVFEGEYIKSDLPIQISASDGLSYSWLPETGLSCSDCQSPSVINDSTNIYTCEIEDYIGCSYKESFIINFINESAIFNLTSPSDYSLQGCNINAIHELPYNENETNITSNEYLSLNGASIQAECGISNISYSDTQTGFCPTQVLRLFSIYDNCDNKRIAYQQISIQDIIAPNIIAPYDLDIDYCSTDSILFPSYSVLEKNISIEDYSFLDGASANDNCQLSSLSYIDSPEGQCPMIITRTFYASDQCGNTANSNQIIILNNAIPENTLIIPNVFTPNGDQINDRFTIINLPPYSSLLVFDKYGKQVYLKENYSNEWNGKDLNNNDLPEDPYWYILITPGLSGKYKGEVYLKRSL